MRVLQVIPEALNLGGTEIYVTVLLRSLPKRFRSDVALVPTAGFRGHPDVLALFEAAGADVRVVSRAQLPRLAARYDLVHVHSWAWYPFIAELPHPKILTVHANVVMPADLDVELAIHTSSRVAERQVHVVPGVTVPSAVDLERFDRARALSVPLEPELAGFFARARTMVRVARPVRIDFPLFWGAAERVLQRTDAQLVVVNHAQADVEALAKLAPDVRARVRLLPETALVAEHVARASLFLYAAQPNAGTDDLVLKEAMALEVPVVVAEAHGSASAADGGVVADRTPEALGDAAIALLNDPARARTLGQRGRHTVELAHERFGAEYARIYATFADGLASADTASGWKQPRDLAGLVGRQARGEVTRLKERPDAGLWSCATRGDPELEVLDLLTSLVRTRRPKVALVTGGGASGLVVLAVAEGLRLAASGRCVALPGRSGRATVAQAIARAGLAGSLELADGLDEALTSGRGADLVVLHGAWADRLRDLPAILGAIAPGALVVVPDVGPQFDDDAQPARRLLREAGFGIVELPTPRGLLLAQRPSPAGAV